MLYSNCNTHVLWFMFVFIHLFFPLQAIYEIILATTISEINRNPTILKRNKVAYYIHSCVVNYMTETDEILSHSKHLIWSSTLQVAWNWGIIIELFCNSWRYSSDFIRQNIAFRQKVGMNDLTNHKIVHERSFTSICYKIHNGIAKTIP